MNQPQFFRALFPLSLTIASLGVAAQAPLSTRLPAGMVPGSCSGLTFPLAGISVPPVFEALVQVDEQGHPSAASPLTKSEIPGLGQAVVAVAMSCKYIPETISGLPVASSVRFILPLKQAPGEVPGAKPAIANLKECAPGPDDYPAHSRRWEHTGTTRVSFTVDPKGQLTAFGVAKSSGHLLLDFTALVKLANCRFLPGKSADGAPIGGSFTADYVWTLS